MAVAARPPGAPDARVPCPLCGGLVHPIAGRCKHCKADLAAQRAARPAAAVALPPLSSAAAARRDATPPPADPAATIVEPAPVTAMGDRGEGAGAMLPPRPTERMQAPSTRSLWRHWPTMAIVVAAVAIVAAIVLMVWPSARTAKAAPRTRVPAPAPERMDTNPLPAPSPRGALPPPSNDADPWGPGRGAGPRGSAPPGGLGRAVPAPDDDDAILSPDDLWTDPFANPRPGVPSNRVGGLGSSTFMITVIKHACQRLASCGSQLTSMCDMVEQLVPDVPPAPSCAAAQRCLDRVDQLDCSMRVQGPGDVLTLVQDCADALVGC